MKKPESFTKTKFWIVLRPLENSTIESILFDATIEDLDLMTLGGLKAVDLVGLFIEHRAALNMARFLIAERDSWAVERE
jgi:hypothetical protein